MFRGADKSLSRSGSKQARNHVRDARDFNNIETRAIIKLFFPQGKASKEIHAILTETLACLLPGRSRTYQHLCIYIYIYIYIYSYKGVTFRSNSNALKPDWPQIDRPASCVIAHQYSTVTIFTLPYHSLKGRKSCIIFLVCNIF